jgi:hypothetical protein
VLFNKPTLDGLLEGSVTATYRRWITVRVRPGSRFTTRAGMVEVLAISEVDEADLSDHDAEAAGFASLPALLKWTSAKGSGAKGTGSLYRIELRLAGPDPRVALREDDGLSVDDFVALQTKLGRMDRAAPEPWTEVVLRQISQQPAVVSTDLAAQAGLPRGYYKIRVRRLKALGLTESLEVGYRLSRRGAAYLSWLDQAL